MEFFSFNLDAVKLELILETGKEEMISAVDDPGTAQLIEVVRLDVVNVEDDLSSLFWKYSNFSEGMTKAEAEVVVWGNTLEGVLLALKFKLQDRYWGHLRGSFILQLIGYSRR